MASIIGNNLLILYWCMLEGFLSFGCYNKDKSTRTMSMEHLTSYHVIIADENINEEHNIL